MTWYTKNVNYCTATSSSPSVWSSNNKALSGSASVGQDFSSNVDRIKYTLSCFNTSVGSAYGLDEITVKTTQGQCAKGCVSKIVNGAKQWSIIDACTKEEKICSGRVCCQTLENGVSNALCLWSCPPITPPPPPPPPPPPLDPEKEKACLDALKEDLENCEKICYEERTITICSPRAVANSDYLEADVACERNTTSFRYAWDCKLNLPAGFIGCLCCDTPRGNNRGSTCGNKATVACKETETSTYSQYICDPSKEGYAISVCKAQKQKAYQECLK